MAIFDEVEKTISQLGMIDADAMGGESVTYTPYGGTAVTRYAIVDRREPTAAEVAAGIVPSLTIAVANDATKGIALTSLNIGGDTIAVRFYQNSQTFTIRRMPIQQDAGMLTFELV